MKEISLEAFLKAVEARKKAIGWDRPPIWWTRKKSLPTRPPSE